MIHGGDEVEGKLKLGLWLGVLGAPVAWLLQLQTAYSLVPWTCKHGKFFLVHLSSALFLFAALGAGVTAWRSWRAALRHEKTFEHEGMDQVAPFMGHLGIALSALFALLILAQAFPTFILTPCAE